MKMKFEKIETPNLERKKKESKRAPLQGPVLSTFTYPIKGVLLVDREEQHNCPGGYVVVLKIDVEDKHNRSKW